MAAATAATSVGYASPGVGLDEPRRRRQEPPLVRRDQRVVRCRHRARKPGVDEARHPHGERRVGEVGVPVRAVDARQRVLPVPRLGPEGAHLGEEGLRRCPGDHRRVALSPLWMSEAELRQAERRHLVRDESPLPCEPIPHRRRPEAIVARLERHLLLGERSLRAGVPAQPGAGVPPAPPRGEDARHGERGGEREDTAHLPGHVCERSRLRP
jgi:hypothetical protein